MRLVLLTVLLATLLAGIAAADAPPPTACVNDLACMQERVRDLAEYREYLEQTLAVCKSANKALSAALTAKQNEIDALKTPAGPTP